MKIQFVSYDGSWPNLCSGILVMKVGRKEWTFPSGSLRSGGNVWFDDNWSEHVEDGEWGIWGWPENYPEEAKEATIDAVNSNVSYGCCGGCV